MGSGKTRSETLNSLHAELRTQATRTVIFHSAVAARLGITVTDLSCLNLLSAAGPQTPGQLAELIGITRGGAVTTMIDRLERAGFVRRGRDPLDRRRVLVEPISTVADAVAPLFAGLAAAVGEHLAGYSDRDLEVLLRFVGTLNRRVAVATDELRTP
ncbi:MarR family winged helix-turn-helix transcriptional regulator [Nocardia sp. NPDC057440]|uniref:MarR family winged helix-turn-helix transcriptional regulator n=1 Tax=Nocardia sp. NPDC057440 TaxID=3346134 RepID=UPI00366A5AA5